MKGTNHSETKQQTVPQTATTMKPTLTLLTALLLAPLAGLAQDTKNPGTSMTAPKLLPAVEIAGTAWKLDKLP